MSRLKDLWAKIVEWVSNINSIVYFFIMLLVLSGIGEVVLWDLARHLKREAMAGISCSMVTDALFYFFHALLLYLVFRIDKENREMRTAAESVQKEYEKIEKEREIQ